MDDLRHTFGDIDVYLFDQLQKGRIAPGARVLDAATGSGRNLVYLARRHDVHLHAVDRDRRAIARTRDRLAPIHDPASLSLAVADLLGLPFPSDAFDVVIACAVLHFASDDATFGGMLDELWRVVAPGGFLFTRLASLTGLEGRTRPLGHGRHVLPDRSTRYLVDDDRLVTESARLGGTLLDPIKTTVVHGQRAMSTWVLGKARG